MRYRLTSGILPSLAVVASMISLAPTASHAWDEDRVSSEIQPYFGVWLGTYMVNTDDLYDNVLQPGMKKALGDDYFSTVRPAAGLSLGVAYSRLHVGINAGYQLADGNTAGDSKKQGVLKAAGYFSKYEYQLFPIDLSVDVALLRNESPINLLVGGSLGLGLMGFRLPYSELARIDSTDTVYTKYYNEWAYTNALLGTAYFGARINLARRLNLEGQIGWRFLTTDGIYLGNGGVVARPDEMTIDSAGRVNVSLAPIPVNLSGAYFRADLRWTFASQVQREEERDADRARRVFLSRATALRPTRAVD